MIPKKFFKMTVQEQEVYLVQKLTEIYEKEKVIKRALAKVRGKNKIEPIDIDRPDLLELKGEN
jgi:hypothetical protein